MKDTNTDYTIKTSLRCIHIIDYKRLSPLHFDVEFQPVDSFNFIIFSQILVLSSFQDSVWRKCFSLHSKEIISSYNDLTESNGMSRTAISFCHSFKTISMLTFSKASSKYVHKCVKEVSMRQECCTWLGWLT